MLLAPINFFEAGFLMWVGLALGFVFRNGPSNAYALIISFWAVAVVFDPYIMGYNHQVSIIINTFSMIFWLAGAFVGSRIKSDHWFSFISQKRITYP